MLFTPNRYEIKGTRWWKYPSSEINRAIYVRSLCRPECGSRTIFVISRSKNCTFFFLWLNGNWQLSIVKINNKFCTKQNNNNLHLIRSLHCYKLARPVVLLVSFSILFVFFFRHIFFPYTNWFLHGYWWFFLCYLLLINFLVIARLKEWWINQEWWLITHYEYKQTTVNEILVWH